MNYSVSDLYPIWLLLVDELIDEILATNGPATYTDGLIEGNCEQVITDSSVGEGPSLAPSPDIFLFNTRVCSMLCMTSQVTWCCIKLFSRILYNTSRNTFSGVPTFLTHTLSPTHCTRSWSLFPCSWPRVLERWTRSNPPPWPPYKHSSTNETSGLTLNILTEVRVRRGSSLMRSRN